MDQIPDRDMVALLLVMLKQLQPLLADETKEAEYTKP